MRKIRTSILLTILTLSMILSGCGSSSETAPNVTGLGNSYDGAYTNSDVTGAYVGGYNDGYSINSTIKEQGSTSDFYEEDITEDTYYEESVDTTKPEVNNNVTSSEIYETKLIYYSDVEIETMNFDTDYANLKELIKKYDGFIEQEMFTNSGNSYLYDYRYSSDRAVVKRQVEILIRIPTDNFDAFNSENESRGNLISKISNVENITQTYYDTTAQVDSLEIQLARLQEMMNNAYDYEDMITLNQEITRVEYQLNQMKTQVRTMDMDVAYSYIAVELKEVVEYSEIEEIEKDTFWNRLKDTVEDSLQSFGNFLEEILFTVIMLVPYLVILAILLIVIKIVFGKKIKEHLQFKKQERKALLNILTNKDTKESKDEVNNKAEETKDESSK